MASSEAQAQRPKIAVFSGPTATIQNSEPLVTSNKARKKYGLPLRANPDKSPARFDALRPQRLAAPVTVYVEQFSAHPLERDAAELYGPPDATCLPRACFGNNRKDQVILRYMKSLYFRRMAFTHCPTWPARPMMNHGTTTRPILWHPRIFVGSLFIPMPRASSRR
jgi:hypothetical protein